MASDDADRAGSALPLPFLEDARRNLVIVWQECGPHSSAYRGLVRRYRRVAAELSLAQPFEQMLQAVADAADAQEPPLE